MVMDYTKAPRIYGDYDLDVGHAIALNDDHCHYLLSVMRRNDGDIIRIFNNKNGEFIGKIVKKSKKLADLHIIECILLPKLQITRKKLYFCPIKKDRLGFLIEKCVELGVTDLCPVISDHTENRKLNSDKVQKQIIEAVEQCERLDIPQLHNPTTIDAITQMETQIYCAIERQDAALFAPDNKSDCACLIGPEGGWSAREIELLSNAKNIVAVSLGDTILRAETAAICMLARLV